VYTGQVERMEVVAASHLDGGWQLRSLAARTYAVHLRRMPLG
jgi:hypothetical protein